MATPLVPTKRRLPKLMSCMTKNSVDNYRNQLLFNLNFVDAKGIRRQKIPIHECITLELQEAGFTESSNLMQDLYYDNQQLIEEDHIGTTVDIRKRPEYLECLRRNLEMAEQAHDRGQVNKESVVMLKLALYFTNREKGVLWLADKLYLTAIAVASQYQLDGGRQKNRCKYYFAKFLLDKFPELGPDSAYDVLSLVRDECNGKPWLLYDSTEDDLDDGGDDDRYHEKNHPQETIFVATAMQLFRILCDKIRNIRHFDPLKAERLARVGLRRAADGGDQEVVAKAFIELGLCQFTASNFKSSMTSFEAAHTIYEELKNAKGICEAKMHLAAVLQRVEEYESAAKLLTVMGTMAMEHNLRRHLGRALHLLGELHLRSDRPDLGTHHLSEAFLCFMGFRFQTMAPETSSGSSMSDSSKMRKPADVGDIFDENSEIFIYEAEQSRLMMAVSAGQEVMASFFELLHDARDCTIAKVKTMEWKLSNLSWAIYRKYHDFIPCPCPRHKRTALDALWLKLAAVSDLLPSSSSYWLVLNRQDTVQDITLIESTRRLQSSHKPLAS